MILLYNIGIRMYYLYILLGSLFNKKARLWIRGRRHVFHSISKEFQQGDKVIWFHCSSLGEFEQGRPVMEELKVRKPDHKILLTFFSPSGYEIRKNYQAADLVCYLPLDTKRNARRFISLVRPDCTYFVKYEYWYHFITQLSSRNIPVYVFSAIFRSSQIFFRSYGQLFRNMLKKINHVFVQDQESMDRLMDIGISHVSIAGDTRFDRVQSIVRTSNEIPELKSFKQDHTVLIGGSTWPDDEDLLIRYINQSDEGLKFIIAPHEIHESGLLRLEKAIKKKCLRFTILNTETIDEGNVILVDTIGFLSSLYRYGDIALIGGGFGKGIHNILEAATFGMPVVFGPNYEHFREAVEMIAEGAAFSVIDYQSFSYILEKLLSDKAYLSETASKAREYVAGNTGATDRIVSYKGTH